jgi:hypothetical protein
MEVEREREREGEPFKVLLFCLYISQTHFVFFVAFMVWTLGLPGQKWRMFNNTPTKVYKGSLAQFVVVELVQDVKDRKQIVINICMLCSLQAVLNT